MAEPDMTTATGGLLDLEKVPDARGRVITSEVFGLARPQYNLRQICRVHPSVKQSGRIYIGTKLAGTRKVPAFQRAPMTSQSYYPVEFTCWKNVTHVGIPIEAEMQDIPGIVAMNTTDAAASVVRMENADIIDALVDNFPSGNVVTGSDWDVATNEPSVDLASGSRLMNTLSNGVYSPTVAVMQYGTWVALSANPEAKKFISTPSGFAGKAVGDRYFGLSIFQDQDVPLGEVYLLDTNAPALILVDGPEKAFAYEDGPAMVSGYVLGKFLYTRRMVDNACVKISNVVSV